MFLLPQYNTFFTFFNIYYPLGLIYFTKITLSTGKISLNLLHNINVIIQERLRDIMQYVKLISYLLIIIGALNWGLIGSFNFDLVAKLFGDMTIWSRAIYTLVGVSALVSLITMAVDKDSCI